MFRSRIHALKASLVFVALATIISSCAERAQLPAKTFEGTITEVISMPGLADLMSNDSSGANAGGNMMSGMVAAMANMNVKMYVRPEKVAYDMSVLGGLFKVHSIIDRNTRKLTMLMPNNTAVVTDLRSLDSIRGKVDDSLRARPAIFDSMMRLMPRPTGKTEKIQGLNAEQYTATSGDFATEMWLSDDERVRALDVVRDALLGRHQTGEGGMEEFFSMMAPIAGKLPVKFETRYKGKVLMTGGLKKIEEGPVDDAQFEIPKGYRIISGDSLRNERQTHRERPRTFTAPPDTSDED